MNPDNQNTAGIEAQLASIAAAIQTKRTIQKRNIDGSFAIIEDPKILIGIGTLNISGASGAEGNITFPTGYFAAPPVVIGNGAGVNPGVAESGDSQAESVTFSKITATGCSFYIRNWATSVTATFRVHFIALGK